MRKKSNRVRAHTVRADEIRSTVGINGNIETVTQTRTKGELQDGVHLYFFVY